MRHYNQFPGGILEVCLPKRCGGGEISNDRKDRHTRFFYNEVVYKEVLLDRQKPKKKSRKFKYLLQKLKKVYKEFSNKMQENSQK